MWTPPSAVGVFGVLGSFIVDLMSDANIALRHHSRTMPGRLRVENCSSLMEDLVGPQASDSAAVCQR